MFCTNCGSEINGNDAFCTSCGTRINYTAQTSESNTNSNGFYKKDYDFIMSIKPFLIAAFILLITNPIFSSFNLFDVYNPLTQEKANFDTISLMQLISDFAEKLPIFIIVAVLGIILLIISAIIMIIPLIKKKQKPLPKHFILAQIMSLIAFLANAGVFIIVFYELNESKYSDFIKISLGGIINIIACISLVVTVFSTAAKVKKVRRLENENGIYYDAQ